jgi:hypothetical protein
MPARGLTLLRHTGAVGQVRNSGGTSDGSAPDAIITGLAAGRCLIQLKANNADFPGLRVLDEKHDQGRNNGCARVDDELPGVGIAEQGAGGPGYDDDHRRNECPRCVPTSRAVFSAICPKNRFIAPSSVITLRFPISLQSWADFCLRAGYRDAGLPIKSRLVERI